MSYEAYFIKDWENSSSFDLNEEWVTKLVPNIDEIFNINGEGILALRIETIEQAINDGIIFDPCTIYALKKNIEIARLLGHSDIFYICM